MSYYNNHHKSHSPARFELHVPKMTISSEKLSRENLLEHRSRGSIGKRIGAQFFGGSPTSKTFILGSTGGRNPYKIPNSAKDTDYEVSELSSEELMKTVCTKSIGNRRLGDFFLSSSNLKTGIILEDSDIGVSRTGSENWPEYTVARDHDLVRKPSKSKLFDEPPTKCHKSTLKPTNTTAASASSSVEDDLSYVTEQLQLIQQTQDSILNSLRTDIDVVQAENMLLNQKNSLLQTQVSHLNQLVADLSMDLRQMRDVVRSKQAIGASLNLLHGNAKARTHYQDEVSTTPPARIHAEQSYLSRNSPRPQPNPSSSVLSHGARDQDRQLQQLYSSKSKSGSDSKKSRKAGKKSKEEDENDATSARVVFPPPKSRGCFQRLFKSKNKESKKNKHARNESGSGSRSESSHRTGSSRHEMNGRSGSSRHESSRASSSRHEFRQMHGEIMT